MIRSFGKLPDLVIVVLAIILVPRIATYFAMNIRPFFGDIDPDRVYVFITLHHVFQLVLTLLLMKLWVRVPLSSWGLNLRNYKLSLKIFAWFCLAYFVIRLASQVIIYFTLGPPSLSYDLNFENVAGELGFQFLLSGGAEEPLFRGFVMTLLSQSWTKIYKVGRVEVPVSGLWATLLFMFAHIGIDYSSFTVTSFSALQQLLAFSLGIFYAVVFHKTRSLLAPMLAHGYSNGVFYIMLYMYVCLVS